MFSTPGTPLPVHWPFLFKCILGASCIRGLFVVAICKLHKYKMLVVAILVWLCDTCWYSGSTLKCCLTIAQFIFNRYRYKHGIYWYQAKVSIDRFTLRLPIIKCLPNELYECYTCFWHRWSVYYAVAVLSIVHTTVRDPTLFLKAFVWTFWPMSAGKDVYQPRVNLLKLLPM